MRKLSKPWPPDDVSPEGQVARSLVDAETSFRVGLRGAPNKTQFARHEFDRLEKSKLRAIMFGEQGNLCVFCERRVEESDPPPRVDHWCPISQCPDETFSWKNLHLSCHTRGTCDDCKGERSLKWDDADNNLPWPSDFDYQRHIGFTSRGEMYVRNDTGLTDARRLAMELAIADKPVNGNVRKTLLNLNAPALVAARAAAIDQERFRLEKQFPNSTAPVHDRHAQAGRLRAQKRLEPFLSIRIAWLMKQTGRGK